jgi:integrase
MLTDMAIKKAKPKDREYRLADGNGLVLAVRKSGAKLWQYRFTLNGKQSTYSIGSYPDVSLLDARIEHDRARKLVKQGTNPNQAKKLEQIERKMDNELTFNALADEWFEQKQAEVVPRSAVIIAGLLKNHARPVIGDLPVKAIKPAHVLNVLKEMEAAGKHTAAIRCRQVMSNIFRFGVVTLRCETDPASPLDGYIKRPPIEHARALSRGDMRDMLCKLADYEGRWVTRELVLFQLLTFVRSVEAIGAQWSEIDWDKALWRIPAERMKMRRPHLVPLSETTLSLLRSVERVTGKWAHIFPGTDKRKPMGSSTINNFIRNALFGYQNPQYGVITSHDFRATASTWLHEEGFLHDAIELQLAHSHQSKVVATYNQSEHLERRRELMVWYSAELVSLCPRLFEPRF